MSDQDAGSDVGRAAGARRVVAAVCVPWGSQRGGALVVVCDDGAVFQLYHGGKAWKQLPDVPGTGR